jgi:hypothetical protein
MMRATCSAHTFPPACPAEKVGGLWFSLVLALIIPIHNTIYNDGAKERLKLTGPSA